MSSSRKLWIAVAVTAVAGVLVGGGATWAIQRQSLARVEAKLAVAEASATAQAERIAQLEATVASATAAVQALESSPTPAPSVTPTTTPTAVPAPAPGKAAREFSFIEKATVSGSKASVSADYAQYLTGPAAVAAATAHGDESPPPNDYYVVNDSTKLRTLPVKAGISVKLVSKPDGTMDVAGYLVPLATWAGYYASPSPTTESILGAGYWLTIKNGVVTGIEEQYVP